MTKTNALVEPLTRREMEILALLAQHRTNDEIAACLCLSVNSVKWYARQIYGKLGIENRRQVAARASELGLLPSNFGSEKSASQSTADDPLSFTSTMDKPKHNLPLQLTSFIGREVEIEGVTRLLRTSRLVTLTGAGGVGKTRLALAIGWQVGDEFKDGVWLVELAALGEPELITGAIAAVFGVRADQNRPLRTALLDYLREKQLLLILDNCEHLIDACAEMVSTILQASPRVSILATSREALGLEGEAPFYVPSLSFPEAGKLPGTQGLQTYEAVKLFLDRARLVLPEFTIAESNAIHLAKICQRLDGIPLALELAAARLQVLSVEQIADRLGDRFRLLTGGSRRALPRHQTLHALIDWSYELLTGAEQTLFRRLAVFAGGWTLDAVEAVCSGQGPTTSASKKGVSELSSSEILDLLSGLAHKSLVQVDRDGDVVRKYRMLETIRQYAQEKLVEDGEAEKYRDHHLDYYLSLAEESEPLLRGHGVLERLELLDGEIGNLRLALNWAISSEQGDRVARGLRLGSALCFYWYFRGIHEEGMSCLKKGLEAISKNKSDWMQPCAKANFVIANLIFFVEVYAEFDEARPLLEESLELYRESQDQLGMALAQCALGFCLMRKYDSVFRADINRVEFTLARSFGEQGLDTCRRLGKAYDIAFALFMNNYIFRAGMEFSAARAYGEECLAVCEEAGDKATLSGLLIELGTMVLIQGDLLSAEKYFQKAFRLAQEMNDKVGMMGAYTWLTAVAFYQQDFERIESLSKYCLELNQEASVLLFDITSYKSLALLMVRQEKWARAQDYLRQYLSLVSKTPGYEYDQRIYIMGMAGVAEGLGQDANAARLLGAVEALFEGFFKPMDLWDQDMFVRISNKLGHRLSETVFKDAWSAGRELTLEQAIEEARQISP